MMARSGQSAHFGRSRGISSSRFRPRQPVPKSAAKPTLDTMFKDRPPGTGHAETASRQELDLHLEGRRLGRLRGGTLRIMCGCGHSGDGR